MVETMKASGRIVFPVFWVTCIAAARACPENCQVIRNSPLSTCSKETGACYRGCITGYFGDKCNMKCDLNCQEQTCQQQDGACTCRTGYTYHNGSCDLHTDVKCQSNDHCLNNTCVSASRRDCMEGCKPGWFGKFCDHSCSFHCICDEVAENCNSCIPGWYGVECGSTCSPGCAGKRCDRESGICTSCIPGWYGAECGSTCSSGCADKRCDRESGICTSCIPGWYGAECGSTCSPGCADKRCDRESGICTSCIQGWHGAECESRCSPGCVEKNCHRNGTCVHKCISGSYGDECGQKCSQHCESGCDQLSGECVQCEAGRYGSTCQFRCSAGCAGANNDCDRDEKCTGGCRKGFYGEKCNSCPQQCFGDLCDVNGTCSACNSGFFGTSCHKVCFRCKDKVCEQKTGECTIGCQSGFFGSFCNLKCEDCTGGDCDRATGDCKNRDKWSSVQSWVVWGVAVVILIIIAVGIYVSRRLKRIQGVVYNIEKRRGGPASAEQDVRPVAAQGYFELEEQVTITPRRVCPIAPIRQTSYIEPRHSGNLGNLQIQPQSQAAEVTDQQNDEPQVAAAPPSDRLLQNVQRRSDEWSERPDSYVLPHYCEVNEEGMATPPQPTQGAQAPTLELKTNLFSVAADVHATRGKIRIPPIAECFGPTGSEDSSPDLQPLVENYDHLNRGHIPRISGGIASSSTQDDDEVRVSLATFSQMSTERPDDYIEPRHSGCIIPPQQQLLSAGVSNQQEDETQAADAPPSDRLLREALIAKVPQPAQGADNSSLSDVADEHTS